MVKNRPFGKVVLVKGRRAVRAAAVCDVYQGSLVNGSPTAAIVETLMGNGNAGNA